ncbi:MAG: G5 domain-containing protein [Oscillospiraceae bacterium]|nr:G5 domain-containing protein [Oscillospiraceae bacterium]
MGPIKKILQKKSTLIRIGALVLAVAVSAPMLTQAVFAKNTYVINDGKQVLVHTTYATDPADVLEEAGVLVEEKDLVETTEGEDASQINVIRGMEITVTYCGETLSFVSYGETVSEFLDRNGIALSENSRVSVNLQARTFDGLAIVISDHIRSDETYTLTLPHEVVYKETDLLKKGTEVVLTEGVDGQKQITANVLYINGKENDRQIITEEVIAEPITKVVAVGTGDGSGKKNAKPIIGDGVIIAPNGDVLTFTHRDTFKGTAYCRIEEGGQVTSTGTPCRVGAVAVDPRVIPYGTRMFIVTKDGRYIYGVATAEDCGGLIKGKRIDLFYETYPETVKFGRRDLDVYFLG